MSPKWKPTCDTRHKYNLEWELKFCWLKKAPNNLNERYCKLCHCTLTPKLSHERTEKHKKHVPKQG